MEAPTAVDLVDELNVNSSLYLDDELITRAARVYASIDNNNPLKAKLLASARKYVNELNQQLAQKDAADGLIASAIAVEGALYSITNEAYKKLDYWRGLVGDSDNSSAIEEDYKSSFSQWAKKLLDVLGEGVKLWQIAPSAATAFQQAFAIDLLNTNVFVCETPLDSIVHLLTIGVDEANAVSERGSKKSAEPSLPAAAENLERVVKICEANGLTSDYVGVKASPLRDLLNDIYGQEPLPPNLVSVESFSARRCGNCLFFRETVGKGGECTAFDVTVNKDQLCDAWQAQKLTKHHTPVRNTPDLMYPSSQGVSGAKSVAEAVLPQSLPTPSPKKGDLELDGAGMPIYPNAKVFIEDLNTFGVVDGIVSRDGLVIYSVKLKGNNGEDVGQAWLTADKLKVRSDGAYKTPFVPSIQNNVPLSLKNTEQAGIQEAPRPQVVSQARQEAVLGDIVRDLSDGVNMLNSILEKYNKGELITITDDLTPTIDKLRDLLSAPYYSGAGVGILRTGYRIMQNVMSDVSGCRQVLTTTYQDVIDADDETVTKAVSAAQKHIASVLSRARSALLSALKHYNQKK